MAPERCETCRYWRDHPASPTTGACHRRSPFAGGQWPWTSRTDWCGEWREREQSVTGPDCDHDVDEPPPGTGWSQVCRKCGKQVWVWRSKGWAADQR